jgi:hypothetical protein
MFEEPTKLAPTAPDARPSTPRQEQPAWLARAISLFRGVPTKWGVIALAGIVLVVVGLLVVGSGRTTRLTGGEPSMRVDKHLSVALEGKRAARVRVEVTPADNVFGGEAERRWLAAAEALPAYLKPISPIYELTTHSADVRLVFGLGEDAAAYALYRWDAQAGQWRFVPAQIDAEMGVLRAQPVKGPVALFWHGAVAPLIGTTLAGDQSLDGRYAAAINLLLIEGAEAQADGTLDTENLDTGTLPPGSYAVLPLIRPSDPVALGELLGSNSARKAHVESVSALLAGQEFAGVALDYGEIDDAHQAAFHALVEDLASELGGQDKLLALRLPTPVQTDSGWDGGPYDWGQLGELADILIVTPPGSPGEYVPGGLTDRFLTWASGEVSGIKLYVAFPALSIDEWAGQLNPITYEYALAPLGEVDVSPESPGTALHPESGQTLAFDLVGEAGSVTRDRQSGIYYYEISAGGGEHRVWLMTAAALRERLDWVAAHHVGGIIIEDLLAEDNAAGMLIAVQEFKVGQPSTLNPTLSLQWTVQDASGAVLSEAITDLGTALEWTPESEGEYVVSADLVGGDISERGAMALIVGGETVGVVPSQEAVVVGAPDEMPAQASDQEVPIPDDLPPPVVPAGAFGNFELGGQTNHVIRNPDWMREAGMDWVKFQLAWGEDMDPRVAWDLIDRGRSENFKVLLSITGQAKYPTEIDVEAYLDFLRGVAYYGPDAIEVWNEVNIDREWPRGQIDGGRYTRELLAPAYNAIKSVNPNIMVISAAPAPTGAYFGEGGCSLQGYGCDDWLYLQQMAEAGAVNYMDCVGAHYNSGATPPSWGTGHPADPGYQHYSWYFKGMLQLYGGTFARPVCFTELGYLSGEGYGGVPERFSWAANTIVAQQAAWLAEAAQLCKESGQVRLMIVWNVDFTYWGDDPMAGYAIIRPNGSCPACTALGNVMH